MKKPKIYVLSGYHAHSHDYWYQQISKLPFHWQLESLPPRYFSWRVRGNPLHLSSLDFTGTDLLLCTSMVDVATLKGLNHKAKILPTISYFHENQFAYPQGHHQQGLVEAQITSIYTALASDSIAFNSEFNRSTFLNGARSFLRKMPDRVPKGIVQSIERKSLVLPVPIEPYYQPVKKPKSPAGADLRIVWNHRWEYDKGPALLKKVCQELECRGISWKISILGQTFRKSPRDFDDIKASFSHRIDHWGYIENKKNYYQILQQAHIVLSTANHDFQGLSILEAVNLGCIPVVPDNLAYQEFLSDCGMFYGPEDSTEITARKVVDLIESINLNSLPDVCIENIYPENLLPQYQKWITEHMSL